MPKLKCSRLLLPRLPLFRLPLLLWGLLLLGTVGCREQVIHQLTESEANRLVTELADAGISAEKRKQADGLWAIAVDQSEIVPALRAARDARLLKSDHAPVREKSSLMSSREDQRFQYERSLAAELEATLRNLPDVLESRVHLNLPLVDPLFGQKLDASSGSASVVLVVSQDNVSRQDVAGVIAGASGIPFKDISIMVTLDPQRRASESIEDRDLPAPSPGEGRNAPAMLVQKSYRWSHSIPLQVGASVLILVGAAVLYRARRSRTPEVFAYEA